MPEPDQNTIAYAAGRLDDVHALLCDLREAERRKLTPGEFATFLFDGETGQLEQTDDVGDACLSYAVYNPNPWGAFVAFGGGPANGNSGAFPIPAERLVVIPVSTGGHVRLGAAAGEIKEASGLIWRVRFHTVQPFFIGAL